MFKSKKKLFASIAIAFGLWMVFGGHSDSYFRDRAVKLKGNEHLCSGEQIHAPSGTDYILTAAHCKALEKDGSIEVTTESGLTIQRRIIAEDPKSDLLLLEGVPNLKGIDIALYHTQHEAVRTYTHGARHDTYRTDGELLEDQEIRVALYEIETPQQEAACSQPKNEQVELPNFFGFGSVKLCVLHVFETGTSAHIVPGSSGGMVVNSRDELVGVVSAGDGVFGYLVTLHDIHMFLAGY